MSEVGTNPARHAARGLQRPVVLLLAQLPPPVHGVTTMTARVHGLLGRIDGARIEHRWSGSARGLDDIDTKSLAKLAGFAGLNLRLLGRLLAGRRADIGYLTLVPWSHAVLRDCLVAWWGKRLARRALVHLHGEGLANIVAGQSLVARLARPLLAGTELIAITGQAAAVAEASGLFTRVIRLPNAVADPGPPAIEGTAVLRLGFLGNLDPRKGVLRFVETLAALAAAGLPVRGDIAGASTRHLTVEDLRASIATRGLDARITVHGAVHGADKARFLANLDLLVYLSRHDHAPLVLIEALAAGLVPVALDTGGVAEIAGPDFAANVLPSDTPDGELQDRVRAIVEGYLASPAALLADRRRARLRYEAEYTEGRFEARLRELLAAGPPERAGSRQYHHAPAAAGVRTALPERVKSPFFAATRALHTRFLARPLPERIAVYFHALDAPDRAALAACVTTLRDLGYRTVSFDRYLDPATTGPVLSVSFDDNYRSWHAALGFLDDLALEATFFTNTLPFRDTADAATITGYFDRLGFAGERVTLTRAELAEIGAAGHTIGCHSHSHALLAELARERWDAEIGRSKRILEDVTGQPVRHFSWPFGMPRHITAALRDYCRDLGFASISAATPCMLHGGPLDRWNVQRSAWRADLPPAENLVNLSIDGRLFTRLTGRSVVG